MSSQASPAAPSPAQDGTDGPGEQMQRGSETPERPDKELAVIFGEMRRAVQLTREQLADRLLTDVETVAALEDGVVGLLPDPGETSRVVATYTNLLGLDARPILRRIETRRTALSEVEEPVPPPQSEHVPEAPPAPADDGGAAADDAGYDVDYDAEDGADDLTAHYFEPERAPRRFGIGRLVRWLILLAVLAGMGFGIWHMAQNPKLFWSTVNALPDPIPRYTHSAWDLLRPLEKEAAPASPAGDPRSRKSDRLPMGNSPAGN